MSNETIVLLNPTAEQKRAHRQRLARVPRLGGLTVGVIDNARPRASVVVGRLAELLVERGLTVRTYRKHHCSFPAETALHQAIAAECDLAIHAVAD